MEDDHIDNPFNNALPEKSEVKTQESDMEFHKLWDVDNSASQIFTKSIIEKVFDLEDVSHKYILIGKDDKTELVEADSVEEALKKASIQNIEKVYHTQHVKNGLIENNNLLKNHKNLNNDQT